MIQSMTAFARSQHQGAWGSAICEIRSVNHRYLELSIRLPETLQALEAPLRERIRHYIRRGKVECTIRFQASDVALPAMTINHHLAEALCKASDAIAKLLPHAAPVNPMDILRWPQILQMAETDVETIQDEMVSLLEKALQDLVDARLREGEELRQSFLQRLDNMKSELSKIRHRLPEIYQQQRSRLIARFNDAKIELDSNRFEQEVVLFAQKMDVSEEMERLDTHISEVRRILKHGGLAGRRLDFLMQELNREANTLGAKSVDVDTTRASVELKVLIEQVREQVQNVE
ncbi:MAG TPA: YicC/YloC family endoribonuclease [Gammaproteobacteria bacterium]|nr:YicC/YloC family endoribonuclease [Gammaproteobacteria bacterium]